MTTINIRNKVLARKFNSIVQSLGLTKTKTLHFLIDDHKRLQDENKRLINNIDVIEYKVISNRNKSDCKQLDLLDVICEMKKSASVFKNP